MFASPFEPCPTNFSLSLVSAMDFFRPPPDKLKFVARFCNGILSPTRDKLQFVARFCNGLLSATPDKLQFVARFCNGLLSATRDKLKFVGQGSVFRRLRRCLFQRLISSLRLLVHLLLISAL